MIVSEIFFVRIWFDSLRVMYQYVFVRYSFIHFSALQQHLVELVQQPWMAAPAVKQQGGTQRTSEKRSQKHFPLEPLLNLSLALEKSNRGGFERVQI